MAQPILEMKGIHKQFGSTIALDKVDLTVYPGEIRGLIGENGSGKSTISSIAAGMQKADQGEMLYHGQASRCLPMRSHIPPSPSSTHCCSLCSSSILTTRIF